jgi:hypothetical protein
MGLVGLKVKCLWSTLFSSLPVSHCRGARCWSCLALTAFSGGRLSFQFMCFEDGAGLILEVAKLTPKVCGLLVKDSECDISVHSELS